MNRLCIPAQEINFKGTVLGRRPGGIPRLCGESLEAAVVPVALQSNSEGLEAEQLRFTLEQSNRLQRSICPFAVFFDLQSLQLLKIKLSKTFS